MWPIFLLLVLKLSSSVIETLPTDESGGSKLTSTQNIPSSCREVSSNVSGIYRIQPTKTFPPMDVRCEMQFDKGGWIVIQNRLFNNESFDRTWNEYEAGFGELNGDFWLGLEKISAIVNNGRDWEIVFTGTHKEMIPPPAKYTNFRLGSKVEEYTLELSGFPSKGIDLTRSNGKKFSTFDRDNDGEPCNCSQNKKGGWWHDTYCCYMDGTMNGLINHENAGVWSDITGTSISIREQV